MSEQNKVDCIYCKKSFDKDDDVVVCPDCGAPHHRDCYKQNGACAQKHLHGTQEAYFELQKKKEKEANYVFCEKCGAQKHSAEDICPDCKSSQNENQNVNSVFVEEKKSAFSQENFSAATKANSKENSQNIYGISLNELAAFIGSSASYYISKFSYLSRGLSHFQLNIGALFFGYAYFFYRKMYKLGFIMFAFFILASMPGLLITAEESKQAVIDAVREGSVMGYDVSELAQTIDINTLPLPDPERVAILTEIQFYASIANIVVSFIAGFYANKAYLKHCLTKIRTIRAGHSSQSVGPAYYFALSKYGRTSLFIAALMTLLYGVFGFCFNYVQILMLLGL